MTNRPFDKKNLDRVKYVKAKALPAEAYELQIKSNKIIIKSSDEAGRFYAHQTLIQLAEADALYRGVIKDAPRYEWRGFMLDEARHFFGKEQVKKILDLMARYKLNKFHWHLSDDQGWRVEIKAYPELCSVGGIGCHSNPDAPARFYTQDEIREIIAYAAERHIEVIPEIDMPGHATAFTKAFPELGAGHRTVNPANDSLYAVLETIIKELADLFPGRYIHIGGDEVSTQGWRELPGMKDFMENNGIDSYDDIQKCFERRISDIVAAAGKVSIAWDDVIDSGLDKDKTVIHWWRADHPESLKKALENGYKTIISPWDPFYLDYVQDIKCKEGHLVWKQWVNGLDEIYDYKLSDDQLVMGFQANLWTERVISDERLAYMVFPRLIAIAERAWTSQGNLDYDDFLKRLENEYRYLDSIHLYYYDFRDFNHHPEPLK
ncbi:MAG: beta-N-acetylhexosaminidase [Bacteroidales bacterium]|nr:beta-N-acetylhexosaminidase [Bacteroidales bacterium]